LIFKGYEKTDYIINQGQIAVRGGIIDFFPIGKENPFRIECWGNEIESIREFDILSQRSVRRFEQIEYYSDLILDESDQYSSLYDYLSEDTLIIIDNYDLINAEQEEFPLPDEHKTIYFNKLGDADIEIKSEVQPICSSSIKKLLEELKAINSKNLKIYLAGEGHIHIQRIRELIENSIERSEEEGEKSELDVIEDRELFKKINWLNTSPFTGFISPSFGIAILTEHQIFDRLKVRNISKQ